MLTDDGTEPSVERNVLRFGQIDGTIYSDQISMSEGLVDCRGQGAGDEKFLRM